MLGHAFKLKACGCGELSCRTLGRVPLHQVPRPEWAIGSHKCLSPLDQCAGLVPHCFLPFYAQLPFVGAGIQGLPAQGT